MKTILIAEDNVVNRELVREMLEAWGFRVLEALDGQQALETIKAERPDLVLMDIQMPALDGFAVMQKIRSEAELAAIPVVALTAYAMRGDSERALSAGFNAYVTKPIDMALLQKEINHHLDAVSNTQL
ncbi:MAG TPA: response regulator [Terriglobales bacterium]|nr:response regulator [Terriglobales bacterium]